MKNAFLWAVNDFGPVSAETLHRKHGIVNLRPHMDAALAAGHITRKKMERYYVYSITPAGKRILDGLPIVPPRTFTTQGLYVPEVWQVRASGVQALAVQSFGGGV